MSNTPTEAEKKAGKQIATFWKQFKEKTKSKVSTFTGLGCEPVLALAMDLERKLVILLPNVLEGLYPTSVTMESLSSLDGMKDAFTNILWNLSKNVKHWSSNFNETDYSVRMEELVIKMLDQNVEDVLDFSTWCLMNGPTNETLDCLQHVDRVDWDYTLGKTNIIDESKYHIPTYDIVDNALVHVPFQVKGPMRYKYACSPASPSPMSVLSVVDVTETSTEEVVVSGSLKFCQLRLPSNLYLSSFLKADEQKQSVIRYSLTKSLEGGAGERVSGVNVFEIDRGTEWRGYVSFRKLFKLVGAVIAFTLLASLFSNVMYSRNRCFYKSEHGPDVPVCVQDLYSSIGFVLPKTLQENDQIGNLLDNRCFLDHLGTFLKTNDRYLSDVDVMSETLEVFKDATVFYSFSDCVKRSTLSKPQKVNLLLSLKKYLLESFYPSAPDFQFNLTTVEAIDVVIATMNSLQDEFQGVHVDDDILVLTGLVQKIKDEGLQVEAETKLQTGDVNLLKLQTQLYSFQKTMNYQFNFLNTRFEQVLNSLNSLKILMNNVTSDFNETIQKLGVYVKERNPLAVVPAGTIFTDEYRNTYEYVLRNLAYNYRILLHEIALPLYTLDSNIHTFPELMRLEVSKLIVDIVNELKDLMIEMLTFTHEAGLNQKNFIVRWFESATGDYNMYSSIKAAKNVTKDILNLNLEIMEKNKNSYKLLSKVMNKMQALQSDLRRDYSVAKEHWVTASIQFYGRFVTGYASSLPSLIGLNNQLFQTVLPYFNLPEIVYDMKAKVEESQRNFREKLMFTSHARVATEISTGALMSLCQSGLDIINRTKFYLWPGEESGLTVKQILKLFEYALYFGISSGSAVQAGVNFWTIGEIPSFTVSAFNNWPEALSWLPTLPEFNVSQANIKDWRMPKVELKFQNVTFTVPSFYLRVDDTNPDEDRKLQIMLEHLIRKYTDYVGPFNMESDADYKNLDSYVLSRNKQ